MYILTDLEMKETKVTLEQLSPNKMSCKLEASQESLKDHMIVQWMHNGLHMHYETLMIVKGQATSEATINDSGWYQCIVKSGLRVWGNSAKLVSQEKFDSHYPLALALKTEQQSSSQRSPYFIYISPDQRISVGGSTKLKCIAGGNPLPRLAWRLNGKVLVW